MKITVAGTGYVGLSISILLAQHNDVIACDIMQNKVDLINNKKSPIVDKEIYEYLDGLIDLNLAIDKIKLNTRHFAKRQLTWFKREKDINMIDISQYNYDFNSVASYIVDEIKKKGIVK